VVNQIQQMTRPMRILRFTLAATVAAMASAAGYPFFLFFICVIGDHGEFTKNASLPAIFFGYALIVTAAHVLALGTPIILLLQHFKKLNFWTLALAGVLAGSLPMAFMNPEYAPWTGLFGFLGAAGFWIVWEPGWHVLSARLSRPQS